MNFSFIKYLSAALLFQGAVIESNAQNLNSKSDHNFDITKNLDIFNSIYRNLDMYYVDTLDAAKTIKIGIDAMLQSLDPYTDYYPEESMDDLKTMTTGKYGGIGSIIRMKKDSTIIIAEPYVGMPAAEVGLQIGDVLKFIDGKDLTGMTTSEVSNMLRGEPGTTFVLKVMRPGEKKLREFKITRRNIKMPAIPYYGMYKSSGYINLSQFTEDCSNEVRKAVTTLKEQGAKSIVLDLRGNGGGLLNEAVNIVNLFVPKDTLIVQTKGKIKAAEATYRTKDKPLDLEIPVAVLVNGSTASASEIVAGALQDLHRATIIGIPTFGKGLVQAPRELPYNGSLKLTTSKYYLPSGRCIQKIDYKKLRASSGKDKSKGEGGITPDIAVKHDTLQNILYYLGNDDVLIDYSVKYSQTHQAPQSVATFEITDNDFEDFKKLVKDSKFTYDRLSEKRLNELKEIMKFEGYLDEAKDEITALEKKLNHNIEHDLDKFKSDIKRMLALEIIKRYFYQAGTVEESLKDDDDLEAAVKFFNEKK